MPRVRRDSSLRARRTTSRAFRAPVGLGPMPDLDLSGFSDEAISADGDLVVTLTGQNFVKEMQTSIVGISRAVWRCGAT